jgi:HK97 gp10 family phage protein
VVALRSRLPKIAAELALKIDGVAEAGAEIIAQKAKDRVPVGSGQVHLRDRIHVERAEGTGWYVIAGDNKAWYGHLVEHGTRSASPHPFLIPAAEESRKDIEAIAQAVGRHL